MFNTKGVEKRLLFIIISTEFSPLSLKSNADKKYSPGIYARQRRRFQNDPSWCLGDAEQVWQFYYYLRHSSFSKDKYDPRPHPGKATTNKHQTKTKTKKASKMFIWQLP